MENIQEIIVFAIIGIAVVIAGYRIIQSLTGKKSGCEGCASDCSGCSLMELKKNVESAQRSKSDDK
jgi:hypothetical protein